jgi:protein TIF31
VEQNNDEPNNVESSSSNELEKLLSKEAFLRIKESGSGLHMKVCGTL